MVLANPDFVVGLKANAAMNEADPSTYFGGTVRAYIDYAALSAPTSTTPP
jgi:hypothetical protein